jgi:hypothetical protein
MGRTGPGYSPKITMKERIKINRDYFKSAATINGNMARPDKMTATRQILLNRGSLRIICSSQSDVSM